MYKILKKDGKAKRAEFSTVHGTVQTPVFMNVGTAAAIKGAVATTDLEEHRSNFPIPTISMCVPEMRSSKSWEDFTGL